MRAEFACLYLDMRVDNPGLGFIRPIWTGLISIPEVTSVVCEQLIFTVTQSPSVQKQGTQPTPCPVSVFIPTGHCTGVFDEAHPRRPPLLVNVITMQQLLPSNTCRRIHVYMVASQSAVNNRLCFTWRIPPGIPHFTSSPCNVCIPNLFSSLYSAELHFSF